MTVARSERSTSLDADAIRAYDERAPSPDETETATFGLGCFWGPDATFGAVEGVVRTRVGYAGGTKRDPTYRTLGDHTEVVQVDYDTDGISYRDLLATAFDEHAPRHQPAKAQYQNLVLLDGDDQRAALESFLDMSDLDRDAIETRIEELSGFTPAEDYHQKYSLRSKRWITDAFDAAGYDDEALRESPAAAVLNAYAAGNDVPAAPTLGIESAPPVEDR